jgi:hypothetical protein
LDWRDILDVRIRGWGLDIHAGILLLGVVAFIVVIGVLLSRRGRGWKVTEANFSFGGCGKVKVCPDNDVARVAHAAWVELRTRKAAIPLDPENDVIAEVYDSWYELFRALRDLTRSLPPESVRESGDAPVLAHVLIRALNDGLRPHLTKWQARFRRWYEVALKEPAASELTPQDVQRQYPQYLELVSDMVRTNAEMIEFAEELRKIAHDRRRSLGQIFRRRTKTTLPEPTQGG